MKRLSRKDFRQLLDILVSPNKNAPKVNYTKMIHIYAREKKESDHN